MVASATESETEAPTSENDPKLAPASTAGAVRFCAESPRMETFDEAPRRRPERSLVASKLMMVTLVHAEISRGWSKLAATVLLRKTNPEASTWPRASPQLPALFQSETPVELATKKP